jgi:hypothetical protein
MRYSRKNRIGAWLLAGKEAGFVACEEEVNTKAGAAIGLAVGAGLRVNRWRKISTSLR